MGKKKLTNKTNRTKQNKQKKTNKKQNKQRRTKTNKDEQIYILGCTSRSNVFYNHRFA